MFTGMEIDILMLDSVNGRTCLHYAAYYGHSLRVPFLPRRYFLVLCEDYSWYLQSLDTHLNTYICTHIAELPQYFSPIQFLLTNWYCLEIYFPIFKSSKFEPYVNLFSLMA